MSFTGTFSSSGLPKNSTFDTLTVRTALQLNSGAVFDLYNTADKTTNYERLRADYSSNIARIFTQFAGSGSARELRVGVSASSGGVNPTSYISFATGTLTYVMASNSGAGPAHSFSATSSAASGTTTFVSVAPTANQSGTAGYTAFDINPTETATGSGTKLLQRWAVGGSEKGRVGNDGVIAGLFLSSTGNIGFASAFGSANDVTLFRDAADTLALRRSTNAQTFRVYNTYTDASNYERITQRWSGSVFAILSEAAGTGTVRAFVLGTEGSAAITLRTGATDRWNFSSAGHFLANADNTYDIGASGANRPRNLYIGGSASFGQYYGSAIAFTVATLSAAGLVSRARAFVSDSTVAAAGNFGAIVAGGGANIVPVFSDGTNWRIG